MDETNPLDSGHGLRLGLGKPFSYIDKGPRIVYLELAGNVRPPSSGRFHIPKTRKPHVTFHDYCAELQRRLPIAIEAYRIPLLDDRAIVGIHGDGVTWNCALNLEALIEIETALAARAAALKLVTVH